MEFAEKLQQLRKNKTLTQEELAAALFVSRTAVSKWESGRGYPGIDSLKALAAYFGVSVDELLSGRELMAAAEADSAQKTNRMRDLVFGLLDCTVLVFFFLPFFGGKIDGVIYEIPLPALTSAWHFRGAFFALTLLHLGWGVLTLALQTYQGARWQKWKGAVSLGLSACGVLLFTASLQPYAASFVFMLLLIKGILLLLRP